MSIGQKSLSVFQGLLPQENVHKPPTQRQTHLQTLGSTFVEAKEHLYAVCSCILKMVVLIVNTQPGQESAQAQRNLHISAPKDIPNGILHTI